LVASGKSLVVESAGGSDSDYRGADSCSEMDVTNGEWKQDPHKITLSPGSVSITSVGGRIP
jgi:hypothetical protein